MSSSRSLLLSIIVPVYNEAASLPAMVAALQAITHNIPDYDFELLFVDDGSNDDSAAVIRALAVKDKRIALIELARNFGKEIATSAGLHACRGQAAIMIDADMQHPPAIMPQFIDRWQQGDDVVIGRREASAAHASLPKRLSASWFYRLMNRISTLPIMPHATDYRLLDRAVIDEFNRLSEHNRMTRGLIDWLGFQRSYIDFTPLKRQHGERTYSYRQLIKLAADSIVSLSFFPLRIAGYLGGCIVLLAVPLLAFIGFDKFFNHNTFNISGSATLAALLLLLIGIVLVCQGLMALYIGTIYNEVQNRPLYVLKRPRQPRTTSKR